MNSPASPKKLKKKPRLADAQRAVYCNVVESRVISEKGESEDREKKSRGLNASAPKTRPMSTFSYVHVMPVKAKLGPFPKQSLDETHYQSVSSDSERSRYTKKEHVQVANNDSSSTLSLERPSEGKRRQDVERHSRRRSVDHRQQEEIQQRPRHRRHHTAQDSSSQVAPQPEDMRSTRRPTHSRAISVSEPDPPPPKSRRPLPQIPTASSPEPSRHPRHRSSSTPSQARPLSTSTVSTTMSAMPMLKPTRICGSRTFAYAQQSLQASTATLQDILQDPKRLPTTSQKQPAAGSKFLENMSVSGRYPPSLMSRK
ncbi:hypothetical protein EIP91_012302 [Steccherinum ochraceum]|uniref:Uncharacterized protein n=1 Tax=Steccherinum ochraceum TaxID=92696 RepID=A0A4V2MWT6_9APHY|nr:hypothetical protein EIP91_012302 [Steccherinum ochraceum]